MILDPITGTFNIYSTSALHSIQYVSHFASQAFPSPGRLALHSTQLTRLHTLIPSLSKHYLLFLFAIILPLWSSRTLETHSAMGGKSHWRSEPCLSHRTECYKVQDWERRGDRGPGTIRRHDGREEEMKNTITL